MSRVLAAERLSEAQLSEARTNAEREQIEARSQPNPRACTPRRSRRRPRAQAEARAEEIRLHAGAEADASGAAVAELYARQPTLLRLTELETLQTLGENSLARLYVGFDRPVVGDEGDGTPGG